MRENREGAVRPQCGPAWAEEEPGGRRLGREVKKGRDQVMHLASDC